MTLEDMISDIINAANAKEREKAYRILERVGMDRYTANVLAKELYKTLKKNKEE